MATPPPTAPCETTQLTCGNNAATQVAIVSQVCSAASTNPTINVNIETIAGAPVDNLVIDPVTSCLNELQITQIVEQCTASGHGDRDPRFWPPPPPPVIYVPVPDPVVIPAPAPQQVMAYCTQQPMQQPDGSMSTLSYLPVGTPEHDSRSRVRDGGGLVTGGRHDLSDDGRRQRQRQRHRRRRWR